VDIHVHLYIFLNLPYKLKLVGGAQRRIYSYLRQHTDIFDILDSWRAIIVQQRESARAGIRGVALIITSGSAHFAH